MFYISHSIVHIEVTHTSIISVRRNVLLFCGNIPHVQNDPFHATSTNQTTTLLNEGRHLHDSTSRRPSVCLTIPALTALLGLKTDTLNYNWDCPYTSDSHCC